MGTNIFAFVVVLGVLIFFHELGHFLVARLFGVGVEIFSLGFGPRLFGKKIGITDYRVSAIPLGGYVKMIGEEPDAEIPPENIPFSFTHKNVFKRILIVAAGPTFNLFLAVIIFFFIFQVYGIPIVKPIVGNVEKGAPADKAGLKKGDLIVSINDKPVNSWDNMANVISESKGETLKLAFHRDKANEVVQIKPEPKTVKNIFGEDTKRYVIGISSAGEVDTRRINFVNSLTESLVQTYKISELTLVSIVKLIKGSISTKTLGGPIMIAQLAGDQARVGFVNLVFFIALISINLAILNFLPIPVLDGGHMLFFFIEAAIRRPVNIKVREISQQIGIFLLILLMIYVFYNDITRSFSNQ